MKFFVHQAVHAIPVLITAFTILVFIKASSYILPSAYYFSVSSIFKTDSELMLVEGAGISGAKLCQLIKTNKIEAEDLDMNIRSCDDLSDSNVSALWGAKLTTDQTEEIYALWVTKRDDIEELIQQASRSIAFSKLNRTVFDDPEYAAKPTVNAIARKFPHDAASSAVDLLISEVAAALDEEFAPLLNKLDESVNSKELADRNEDMFVGQELNLSSKQLGVLETNTQDAAIKAIEDKGFDEISSHPSREKILETIYQSYSADDVASGILRLYTDRMYELSDFAARQFLLENGVRVDSVKESINNLKKQMNAENLPSYIIAAIIRATVVFLAVSFVSVILLGRYQPPSFWYGASFAAFMLTWPLISLWDIAVSTDWQSLKAKFLLIYLIYIVAFFYTGRLSVIAATKMRSLIGWATQPLNIDANDALNFSTREIVVNLLATVGLNALAYTANFLVPLSA